MAYFTILLLVGLVCGGRSAMMTAQKNLSAGNGFA